MSQIEDLVNDYLNHCRAEGKSIRTVDGAYGYPLRNIFLPWCERQGLVNPSELICGYLSATKPNY